MTERARSDSASTAYNERLILFILAAVQFITIVDFMIVMPLGPQLMRKLQIGTPAFGLVVSSYTFAAGIAGLIISALIDRFPRRTSFLFLYAGFLAGTLFCGVANNYHNLVFARVIAGGFGGVVGGISMAIIGDVFPENRRGRATGAMMTGFAVASVIGVPLGLFVGTNFGWQMSFLSLVAVGLPVLALAWFALPSMDHHIGTNNVPAFQSLATTFRDVNHLNAFALIIALTISGFLIFPFLSVYLVGNVGMTEQRLPLVYIVGGCLTLIASPIVGRLADRYGKLLIFRCIAPVSAAMILIISNLPAGSWLVAIGVFGTLMVCNVGRMIPAMAMVTSSVLPKSRGAFLSANSSIQHIAGGFASYLGGLIVVQNSNDSLSRFGIVGVLSAAMSLISLWVAGRLRLAEKPVISAAEISIPAAAEAAADAGEPLVAFAGADTEKSH